MARHHGKTSKDSGTGLKKLLDSWLGKVLDVPLTMRVYRSEVILKEKEDQVPLLK